jgi:hypothetical protein
MGFQFNNINDLLREDLPGTVMMEIDANYDDVIRSMVVRLSVWNKDAERIAEMIDEQADLVSIITGYEFVLNELAFEMRRLKKSEIGKKDEVQILEDWCTSLIRRFDVNDTLDFYNQVVRFRKERNITAL